MFVQVIQGHVTDPEQAHTACDRWVEQLAPGAVGWLGSTGGVTDDGTLVILARFESAEAARRNSDRHEQDQWWTDLSKNFTGEATFHDSRNVVVDLAGNPDEAGFVQVMQGRTRDPERARELAAPASEWAEFRPELLGSVYVEHDEGLYTLAIYFTSEAAAREGERKEPPPELAEQLAEMRELEVGDIRYFDLRNPWLYTPK